MPATDGGLRKTLQRHLPGHWTPVETNTTHQGVPDLYGALGPGRCLWIECKKTTGWKVNTRPLQVSWHERHARAGGVSVVAVRRQNVASAADQLWLLRHTALRELVSGNLRTLGEEHRILLLDGGPRVWCWETVAHALAFVCEE